MKLTPAIALILVRNLSATEQVNFINTVLKEKYESELDAFGWKTLLSELNTDSYCITSDYKYRDGSELIYKIEVMVNKRTAYQWAE